MAKKTKRKTFKTLKSAAKVLKGKAAKKKTKPPAKAPGKSAAGKAAAIEASRVPTKFNKARALRHIKEIKIGPRHRQDMGDIIGLARSIDARGELLEPIVITADNRLIDGQRRMTAWPFCEISKHGALPIPVHIVQIDSIVAGEYDANTQRKEFTPSEAVAIKRALEPVEQQKAAERKKAGKTADKGKGRAADKVSAITGRDRKTLAKAEEVVVAAEQDPDRFGKLKDDMDRTGRVTGPHNRLKIMRATDEIRNAPPPLPMQGPYNTIVIDFPWPNEPDMTQAELDAQGRSLRPYPAMAIQEGCKFMAETVVPLMADDCTVYFWATNYHLINGHADKLLHALGLDERSTMETWGKDKMGRGQVRRDQTEQCIIAMKGKPVVNLTNETTLFNAPRRENSRKPLLFYKRVEATSPAPRYAEFFSTGGHGDRWDCYGDQAQRFAAGDPEMVAPGPVGDFTDEEVRAVLESGHTEPFVTIRERQFALCRHLVAQKLIRCKVNEKADMQEVELTKAGENRLWELRAPDYRVTPAGELTVIDLVKPGDVVLTSYGTGPYRVLEITADEVLDADPEYDDPPSALYPRFDLSVCEMEAKPDKKGLYPRGSVSGINGVVAVGGRLLDLHQRSRSEVFVKRAPVIVEPLPAAAAAPIADTAKLPRATKAQVKARVKSGIYPPGHVISRTIDHDAGDSVGTCECGFVARVPRDGKTPKQNLARAAEMDAIEEAHWLAVEAVPAAGAAARQLDLVEAIEAAPDEAPAPIAAPASEDDALDIPPFLRRA
jgi:N6-adenosine-specific RNA methylase IME4